MIFMIEKMGKSDQEKIKQIIAKNNQSLHELKWIFKPNVLTHFGVVGLIKPKVSNEPFVTISIDQISDPKNLHRTGYLISGTHFYMDFSKVTINFLLPIQRLIREINDSMCTPVRQNNK